MTSTPDKCAHKDCDRNIDWQYMPGTKGYCDDHVPRGCNCNAELEPRTEFLDSKGRRFPCVEYHYVHEAAEDDAVERLRAKTDPDSILVAKVIADCENAIGYWIQQVHLLEQALYEDDDDELDDGASTDDSDEAGPDDFN